MGDENRMYDSGGLEVFEVFLSSFLFFIEKSGLLKYVVVDFCNIFCCVFRPMREKGVGELLL